MMCHLIRKPYRSASWEIVQYDVQKTDSFPTNGFSRGDVYAMIFAEHISDIEDNTIQLWIATSDDRLVPVPTSIHWLADYCRRNSGQLFALVEPFLTPHNTIRLTLECVREVLRDVELADSTRKYLKIINSWNIIGVSTEEMRCVVDEFFAGGKTHQDTRDAYLLIHSLLNAHILPGERGNSCALALRYVIRMAHLTQAETTALEILRTAMPLEEFLIALVENKKLVSMKNT